ncbi:helix-turn-helix transcriptional regulator [Nocardia goodfellowii]
MDDSKHARRFVMGAEEECYTTEEVARLLKVDESSLRRWRTARPPQGPPFVQLSARVTRYMRADVDAYLTRNRVDPMAA